MGELLKNGLEFGLVGFVIALGVGTIYAIVKVYDQREEKRMNAHRTERAEWRDESKEERTVWREDINRHSEKQQEAFAKLTEAIDRQRLHTRRSDHD